MLVLGLKIRVWCEFVGQNIFSGLDARGGYGHKDFFSTIYFFYFCLWVWVGGKEGTQDVKYRGVNIRYFTCYRD